MTLSNFTLNFCIGFSVASVVMIGNKLGEGDFISFRKIGINNFKLTLIFMGFCGLVFIIFNDVLPIFFTKESDILVVRLASQLIVVVAIFNYQMAFRLQIWVV